MLIYIIHTPGGNSPHNILIAHYIRGDRRAFLALQRAGLQFISDKLEGDLNNDENAYWSVRAMLDDLAD